MNLLVSILVSITSIITVIGVIAFLLVSSPLPPPAHLPPPLFHLTPPLPSPLPLFLPQYPRIAAHRREVAFREKIATRLTTLFNTKESLQQHVDWANADNRPTLCHPSLMCPSFSTPPSNPLPLALC